MGLNVETWILELSQRTRLWNAQVVWSLCIWGGHRSKLSMSHKHWPWRDRKPKGLGRQSRLKKTETKSQGEHMISWKPNSKSFGDHDDGKPWTLKESRRQGLKCPWNWLLGGYGKSWLEQFLASWRKVVNASVSNGRWRTEIFEASQLRGYEGCHSWCSFIYEDYHQAPVQNQPYLVVTSGRLLGFLSLVILFNSVLIGPRLSGCSEGHMIVR